VSQTVSEDTALSERSWHKVARAWQTAFTFCLLLVGLILAADGHGWPLSLALPLFLAASYQFLELPWLLDKGPRWAGPLNLVFVSVGCFVFVLLDANVAFIVSVALSQFSPLTGFRPRGIAMLAAVAAVLSFPMALRDDFSAGSMAAWLITSGSALAFNIFIGVFITELMADSHRRGALIRELEETRAELDRAHHEAGVREERERLAREIHDTLAQGFTSVLMLVQAADATLETDPEATRERLGLAAQTARENLAEARSLIGGQVPGTVADLPLDASIRRVAERTGREAGCAVRVRVGGEPRALTANVQVVIVRVVQEALANVRKHARAADVRVDLAYGDERLRLSVADDGIGFDAAASQGFGTRSMRERVAEVGGKLELRTAPGKGTTVTIEVPFVAPGEERR
jgi:signal transduction histidine kinase